MEVDHLEDENNETGYDSSGYFLTIKATNFFVNDLERRESLARGCVSLVGPKSVHDSTPFTPALYAPRVFAVCPSYV